MRWLNVLAIAETPEPTEFQLETQMHLRRCHPASDKAALDLRCIVARRLSLLGSADQLSSLFKKASPRGLSSSTSCALFTKVPIGKATVLAHKIEYKVSAATGRGLRLSNTPSPPIADSMLIGQIQRSEERRVGKERG